MDDAPGQGCRVGARSSGRIVDRGQRAHQQERLQPGRSRGTIWRHRHTTGAHGPAAADGGRRRTTGAHGERRQQRRGWQQSNGTQPEAEQVEQATAATGGDAGSAGETYESGADLQCSGASGARGQECRAVATKMT